MTVSVNDNALVAALQEIVDLDGKALTTVSLSGHDLFIYQMGSHFAFEAAAKIARKALERHKLKQAQQGPKHIEIGDPPELKVGDRVYLRQTDYFYPAQYATVVSLLPANSELVEVMPEKGYAHRIKRPNSEDFGDWFQRNNVPVLVKRTDVTLENPL